MQKFTTSQFDATDIIKNQIKECVEIKETPEVEETLRVHRTLSESSNLEELQIHKRIKESSLRIKKELLNNEIEWKAYHEKDLIFHIRRYKDSPMLKKEYAERIKRLESRIEKSTEKIKELSFNIHESIELLDQVDKAIQELEKVKEEKGEINTHEKLLTDFLHPNKFKTLKNKGFKGSDRDFISCLLYALDATSAFENNESLTEEEYLSMLVEQMNSVV